MSAFAWLLGFRTVESGEGYAVVRMPIWFSAQMRESVIEKLTADLKVLGRPVRVQRGHRLVRIETA
jgi:hypothetical protein